VVSLPCHREVREARRGRRREAIVAIQLDCFVVPLSGTPRNDKSDHDYQHARLDSGRCGGSLREVESMKYYFSKLLPPRPDFAQTMTPVEMAQMQQHAAYWRTLMDRGFVAAFGPVAGPAGSFGIGILELPDEIDPQALLADDPVIKAGTGFRVEILPMPRAVVRPATARS
jgi:uncharacterized protein YciI